VGVLLLALFLPRPETPYSVGAVFHKLTSPTRETQSTEADEKSTQPDSQDGKRGESSDAAEESQGSQKQSDAKQGKNSQGRSGQPKGNTTGNRSFSPPQFRLQNWMAYLLAAIVAAFLAFRFRSELLAAFHGMLQFLANLLSGFRFQRPKAGGKRVPKRPNDGGPRLLPNPYKTGQAGSMSLAEQVQYTFEGLLVWAETRGFKLAQSDTPVEFGERLSSSEQSIAEEILLLSWYYSYLAYGGEGPPPECTPILQRIWGTIGA
jgi:hypothetical protein